jgi:hypothetical protein
MATNPKRTNLAASTEADAVCALLNTGFLRIYDGTQPVTADTALGAQVDLADLRFGNPAFGAASNGVATANAITSDTDANATSTATWFRAFKSDGTTAVFDGSVAASGGDINLNTVSIQLHAQVDCTSFLYTANKG